MTRGLTGLEEQDDCEHGQSRLAVADNSQDVENNNSNSRAEQDVARLDIQQQSSTSKPSNRKHALSDRISV